LHGIKQGLKIKVYNRSQIYIENHKKTLKGTAYTLRFI